MELYFDVVVFVLLQSCKQTHLSYKSYKMYDCMMYEDIMCNLKQCTVGTVYSITNVYATPPLIIFDLTSPPCAESLLLHKMQI